MLCKKTYLLILLPVGYVFGILFATLKAVRETSQHMGNSLWSSAACLAESGYLLPAGSLSLWCQSWLGSAGFPRVLTIRNLVSLSLCTWEVGTWCREEMLLGVNPCFRGRRERRGRQEGLSYFWSWLLTNIRSTTPSCGYFQACPRWVAKDQYFIPNTLYVRR